MKRNEAFPSKYVSKEDVDPPVIGTIAKLTREKLKSDEGDETKTVMLFKEESLKPLILNNVNWMVCEDAYGEDSDLWMGKSIELYKDPNVMFGAKRVGGVRLRLPSTNGNGHTSQPTVYTFELAVAECEKVGISKQELIDALKARGLSGWSATRDSAILPEIINAHLDKETQFQ